MRRIILAAFISLISMPAFSLGSVECFSLFGKVDCFTAVNFPDREAATLAAHAQCVNANSGVLCTGPIVSRNFQNLCASVFTDAENTPFVAFNRVAANATTQAAVLCTQSPNPGFCRQVAFACDSNAIAFADTPKPPLGAPSPKPVVAPAFKQPAVANIGYPVAGSVVVCLLPVPRAVRNLANLAQSRPEVADEANAEASYLLARYCRTLSDPTFAALGESEELDNNCTQMSGVLKGDQVYWVECAAHYDVQE
jgi:hypothetical protein